MSHEYAVELATSNIRFGPGVTRELGMDLADVGLRRVMLVTDPYLAKLHPVEAARESLEANGIAYALFDRVSVEPAESPQWPQGDRLRQ